MLLLPGFSGYAYYWRKNGSVFCPCIGKQSVRLSAERKKPGGSPEPTLETTTEVYYYGKKKTKSNAVDTVNAGRKERDYHESEAGADDLDRLPDRVFTQH